MIQAMLADRFRLQLHEEMRRALDGAAPPDVDEVFHDHGLVARGRPE